MEKITDLIDQGIILVVNRSAPDQSIYPDYPLINGLTTFNAREEKSGSQYWWPFLHMDPTMPQGSAIIKE
jgi:hypothetical protein